MGNRSSGAEFMEAIAVELNDFDPAGSDETARSSLLEISA